MPELPADYYRGELGAAAIRDIPRSCTCSWRYLAGRGKWVRVRPRIGCPWHS